MHEGYSVLLHETSSEGTCVLHATNKLSGKKTLTTCTFMCAYSIVIQQTYKGYMKKFHMVAHDFAFSPL